MFDIVHMLLDILTTMQAFFNNQTVFQYNSPMPGGRPTNKEASFLGSRIAQARTQAGLSQNDLAEQLGISRSLIAQWERSSVALKADQLLALSEKLNLSVDSLLGKTEPKRKSVTGGRAQKLFEEVALLPRRQQDRILATVEDMLVAQRTKQEQAS